MSEHWAVLSIVLVLCAGCGTESKIEYSFDLGNGCRHVLDHHLRHGIIVDVEYERTGEGRRYYPKKDHVYCDSISKSGDNIFGEVVAYGQDSVRLPATVVGYFAFSINDRSFHEFKSIHELEMYAQTVGIENVPPFKNSFEGAKRLVWN